MVPMIALALSQDSALDFTPIARLWGIVVEQLQFLRAPTEHILRVNYDPSAARWSRAHLFTRR